MRRTEFKQILSETIITEVTAKELSGKLDVDQINKTALTKFVNDLVAKEVAKIQKDMLKSSELRDMIQSLLDKIFYNMSRIKTWHVK
jgi:hypothetical protein